MTTVAPAILWLLVSLAPGYREADDFKIHLKFSKQSDCTDTLSHMDNLLSPRGVKMRCIPAKGVILEEK